MFESINIEHEIRKEKRRRELIFDTEHGFSNMEELILPANYNELDEDNIFDIHDIRIICEKYRLRFLNKKLFKGEIPAEALQKIKQVEMQCPELIKGYSIAAPARLFKLRDSYKDPLLFAHLGNGRFFLVHKWGNDLSWFRALLYYPFRNLDTFLKTNLVISMLLALLVPDSWLINVKALPVIGEYLYYTRIMFFITCFVWISAIAIYISFTTSRNVSAMEWDNKYLN